ncbi:MAG: tautomerase family protein [Bacillota bacterium]|nr:tautomerase family protein [Bacillota bacterium]
MPHVVVQMLEGRSKEQKKLLIEGITKAVCDSCKVGADAVSVAIFETPRDNWGKAGVPMSERK